ncbi:MAG: enoyl-CoA hydratase [Burkholderiales bacterium]|nr:enoyl-CoA hydratase [Burkholderiales bacterium]
MDLQAPQPIQDVSLSADELRPPTLRSPGAERPMEFFFSNQLSAFMDAGLRAMWLRWNPTPRPNFNPALLQDLSRYCHFLAHSEARIETNDGPLELKYAVLASRVKGVFNLGGDLCLFMRLIQSQDYASLLDYGRACINVLYQNYNAHGLPITTISLIQGDCLGGGFEAALSSDVLIAEKSARFGFPEILFNLFPGMGAYSFLERKIGRCRADDLITSGKIYSADDMLNLGVVDIVTDDGKGESEVATYIQSRRRSQNGLVGLAAARRSVHKLDYEELHNVLESWVDSALRLSSRDLKLMERLVSRQNELLAKRDLH